MFASQKLEVWYAKSLTFFASSNLIGAADAAIADVQRIEQKLQRRQALLPIDDRAFLHATDRILDLLQNHGAQEVGRMPVARTRKDALGYAYEVVPEGLPLRFLAPDVGALEQGNDQPLWLHEYELGRSDLCFHGLVLPRRRLG